MVDQALPESVRQRALDAAERDQAAAERDRDALERDRRDAQLDSGLDVSELPPRAAQHVAAIQARATAAREAAATDRERAAQDRRRAARDRSADAAAIARAGIDHLTGALGRYVGLDAIQRELDRTARTGEPLVIAFLDVIGLKRVNDSEGHEAGDAVLRRVSRGIAQNLRAYDVIVRYGGDEFVCSLTGQDLAGARARFDEIARQLEEGDPSTCVSVGFAQRIDGESLDDLVKRADTAMLETRNAARS